MSERMTPSASPGPSDAAAFPSTLADMDFIIDEIIQAANAKLGTKLTKGAILNIIVLPE